MRSGSQPNYVDASGDKIRFLAACHRLDEDAWWCETLDFKNVMALNSYEFR